MHVNCPICSTPVEWSKTSEHRPFCSKKCQLIDLGEWADEERTIQGKKTADAERINQVDIEEIEAMLAEKADDFFQH